MENGYQCQILERAAFQMTSSLNLEEVLTTIARGLVDELDAPLARIWLLRPGDICTRCYQESICRQRDFCLHLKASEGITNDLNGEYRRIPLGSLHVGFIARHRQPLITGNIEEDPRFPDKNWIRQLCIKLHAGYPLLFQQELLGVMVVFSRRELSPGILQHLSGFANQASIAIKNAKLFDEVKQLKNKLQAENVYMREEIKLIHNFEDLIG